MANRFYGYQYDTNPKKLNPENAPYNNRYPQMKKKNLSNLSIPEQRKRELEERQRKDRVNKKEYQENNKKSSQSKKTESKRVEPKKVETKKIETKKAESKKIGKRALFNQEKNNVTVKKESYNNENISIKPADKRETKAKIVAISFILTVFSVLFAISYQNSLISESFNIKEQYKKEYESLSKTNQQIEVGIQNNLNLNNIEKAANDRLGMQKLNNNQKIYVSLPKQDYIAPATEQIIENKETGFFENMWKIFLHIFLFGLLFKKNCKKRRKKCFFDEYYISICK